MRTAAVALLCLLPASAQMLTSQNDNTRTSANLRETMLKPSNVNSKQFGKVFSCRLTATSTRSRYICPAWTFRGKAAITCYTWPQSTIAFTPTTPKRSPTNRSGRQFSSIPTPGSTTVPAKDTYCPFIRPEIGITPTPVIDALKELPCAGLLLANGQVYLTWGSSCDVQPYHGWVMAYDAHTLRQTAVFNTSPTSVESGIWMSDNAPAADEQGNVYLATGNGHFDPGRNFGDSILKLALNPHGFTVRDSFTPEDQERLNARDLGIGSGGPLLTPNGLLLAGGKNGVLYVLDRQHMSKPLQMFRFGGGIYAAPAYWNGHVYLLASDDYLSDFTVTAQGLSAKPVVTGRERFGNPAQLPRYPPAERATASSG